MTTKYFEMRHVVTFEETNLIGNVYYVHYVSWQGRCRELFLKENVPETLSDLVNGRLRLVTAHTSCDFADEFQVFDEVLVRMRLLKFIPSGVSLGFTYSKASREQHESTASEMHARGRQDIKFLAIRNGAWALADMPPAFLTAIKRYGTMTPSPIQLTDPAPVTADM